MYHKNRAVTVRLMATELVISKTSLQSNLIRNLRVKSIGELVLCEPYIMYFYAYRIHMNSKL